MKIAIADDHALVRKGLEIALNARPDVQVMGNVCGPAQLMQLLASQQCDVALVDVNMPGDSAPDGVQLMRNLRESYPDLKIIVLTADADPAMTRLLMSAGIDGFVHKTTATEELLYVLTRVLNGSGGQYLCEATQARLAASESASAVSLASLSSRELDVLELLKKGLTVSAIAKLRKRTVATISHQKISAMKKLKLSGDAELYAVLARS